MMNGHPHQRILFWVLVMLVVLVGLAYFAYRFIEIRHISITPLKTQAELRADVAAILQSSSPASPEKVSAVSSLLSNSKATSSAEKRQNVANMLSK
jgi:capsule polysaccharide export protein KpsE/RkpR